MASISLSFSSSIVPTPISHAKSTVDPILRVTRCLSSAPSSSSSSSSSSSTSLVSKNKHQKGEFPGITGTPFYKSAWKSTPIKRKKKKKKKNAENKNSAKAWVRTLPETFSYCIHKKQWVKALELFDLLREQPYYEPKEVTYMKLIVLLGKSGLPHRAHQLFSTIKEDGCESTQLYTALLAAYCRNSLIDEAFLALDEMKSLPHCQPDISTYSSLIKACVNAQKFELVELLYDNVGERSIMLSTATHNVVLSGYGKAGRFDQMEKLLSSMMQSTTCKPDVWTMNTVISFFGNKGQIDMMEKWYEKFCNFGIGPETHTFNIMIGAYGKKRMYDKIASVMQYMRKLQFPWTTSTFNNVIETFADVGDGKNMEYAFEQMCAEGIRTDTKTFCCLITGYANAGIFHKVISTVRLVRKFKIPENTSFYNAVISACAKTEDLMEMERVFKCIKEKQCQPDDTTYCVMAEAYRKEGMNDKIYYLEQEKQMMLTDDQKLRKPEDEVLD